MFVGWNGMGPLAILVPVVFVIGPLIAINVFGLGPCPVWVTGGLFSLSGVIVALIGRKFNGPLDVAAQRSLNETGLIPEGLSQRHGIYGVRMELWGVGQFLLGGFLIVEFLIGEFLTVE